MPPNGRATANLRTALPWCLASSARSPHSGLRPINEVQLPAKPQNQTLVPALDGAEKKRPDTSLLGVAVIKVDDRWSRLLF